MVRSLGDWTFRSVIVASMFLAHGVASAATTMTLDRVQSYVYAIGAVPQQSGLFRTIGQSPHDLIVIGSDIRTNAPPLDRSAADPNNNKIILSYLDATEATPYLEPELLPSLNVPASAVPSWFGKPMTQFPGTWTVQYWDPRWEPYLFKLIDEYISKGYDGVFVDVLNADTIEWGPGNPFGNPVYDKATQAIAALLDHLKAYVVAKNLDRPFYLMGNSPSKIAQNYPASLKSLDIIFNESVYYTQPLNNGYSAVYQGTASADFLTANYAPLYESSGDQIFGNDYPLPSTDPSTYLLSFEYYSQRGWVASINSAVTYDTTVLKNGPHLFVARNARPVVVGSSDIVNFLSGGKVTSATLTGGNKGDFFIGGPGQNMITGGSGNDMIYAHPSNVVGKNILDIKFYTNAKNPASAPTVTILINGKAAVTDLAITSNRNTEGFVKQDVQVNTAPYGTVQTIEVDTNGIYYTDATHNTNVFLSGLTYEGVPLHLSDGTYSNPTSNGTFGETGLTSDASFNQNGKVVFTPTGLKFTSPFPVNTADTINGGGGVNTVAYRAASSNYTLATQSDGSVLVTSAVTAEGPDTLRNVQFVKFTDKTVAINTASPIRPSAIFSTVQTGTQSFLRFFNTGTSAGTATAVLTDYATGQRLGQWTSPTSVPAGAEIQYAIGNVEQTAGITDTKPNYYSVSVQTDFGGYFQHVLFRPADGTLTNSSTCAAGVTADATKLSGVHSSLIGSAGFPSSVVITNTGSAAQSVTLGLYDARDGTKLGTYTTASIPANGQLIPTVTDMEAGARVTPSGSMYHYVIKAEGTFTGYLQHLVNNTKASVITDMTTACSLDGAASTAGTPPLRDGAIFSTAQTSSQSFLRFYNTGASAGAVAVTLRDYTTGQSVGTWTSPSIAAGAEQQFAISTVEQGANIAGTKPSYYSISATSAFNGYFQHVLFRPSDGTLTNLSTCATGVTADSLKIAGVHSSLLDFGFPSSVVINNTGAAATTVTLGVYDARDGTKLGTYTSASIPAGGQVIPTSAQIETGAHITPSGSMYHYVLKVESAFTGFLQNLVNNLSVGVITDMTTACALKAAGP